MPSGKLEERRASDDKSMWFNLPMTSTFRSTGEPGLCPSLNQIEMVSAMVVDRKVQFHSGRGKGPAQSRNEKMDCGVEPWQGQNSPIPFPPIPRTGGIHICHSRIITDQSL